MICAVCHRSRAPGASSDTGDVFVCVRCKADAAQFTAIHDSTVEGGRAVIAGFLADGVPDDDLQHAGSGRASLFIVDRAHPDSEHVDRVAVAAGLDR